MERVLEEGDTTHPNDEWEQHPESFHEYRFRRHLDLHDRGVAKDPNCPKDDNWLHMLIRGCFKYQKQIRRERLIERTREIANSN